MCSSNRTKSSMPMALVIAASLALTLISLPVALAIKAAAAEPTPLDTSKLPRLSGAKVMFESPQTTILSVSVAVPAAADAQAQALKTQGWIAYVPPSTEIKKTQSFDMRTFKKGRQGLTLMVQSAPQGGATTVQFTEAPIASDMPVPADAADVVFDASRPFVTFTTGAAVRDAFAAFEAGLKSDGWQRWEPAPGQTSPTVEITDEIARMFYVKAGAQYPIYVTVNSKPGPRVLVKAETVPPSLLNPPKAAEAKSSAPSPAEEAARKTHSELSDAMDKAMSGIAEGIMKDVQTSLANGGAAKPAAQETRAAASVALSPMNDVETSLPVPEGAEGLSIGDDEVEFESAASVPSLGAFYKGEMKKAGWSMRPSVIARDTMDVQNYSKGGKSIDITIMQMGPKARVTARGTGLQRTAEKSRDASTPGEAATAAADVKFEAEDKGGLPVPKPHSMAGREATLFRVSVTAAVEAPVSSVVAFYRDALNALSWSEDTTKAKITTQDATLSFTSPDGPAVLSVTQKGSEATSVLFVRKTKDAEASGLMPKAGKVTLLIGNAAEAEASVKAAGKTVKAAPGIGTKNPDGPKLELEPGQQKIVFEFKGGKPESETLDVKAGEIWGILVAPGGALPMQLY